MLIDARGNVAQRTAAWTGHGNVLMFDDGTDDVCGWPCVMSEEGDGTQVNIVDASSSAEYSEIFTRQLGEISDTLDGIVEALERSR